MIDEFTVEAVDLGPLKKLRIGHNNCGIIAPTASHRGKHNIIQH